MKHRLAVIAFWVGVFFLLGPWVFFDQPSRYWLLVSAAGGVLTSLAGYNAQAKMMGMGEPGEDILQSFWRWLTSKFRRERKK